MSRPYHDVSALAVETGKVITGLIRSLRTWRYASCNMKILRQAPGSDVAYHHAYGGLQGPSTTPAIILRMPDYAALVTFFEQGIPFNLHLGLRVESIASGHCRLRIPFNPALVGDPFRPALHGGVSAMIADTAGGLAVFAHVGSLDARVSTVDLRMDYYAPAPLADLYADADVVRVGNRVGVARIVVHAGDPAKVLAEGKGVYNLHKPR